MAGEMMLHNKCNAMNDKDEKINYFIHCGHKEQAQIVYINNFSNVCMCGSVDTFHVECESTIINNNFNVKHSQELD